MYKEKKRRDHSNQMSQLYLSSMYSDVVFVIQEKKIFAHKLVLGTRCQYFSNMFSSGMLESNQKEIEIPDCKAATFEALLKYIYCDELDFTEDLALDLLVLSNKWLFKELEEDCEEFLADTMTLENAIDRAELANKFEAGILTNAVIEFIIQNLDELEKKGDLHEMPPAVNVKVMVELKKRVEEKKK